MVYTASIDGRGRALTVCGGRKKRGHSEWALLADSAPSVPKSGDISSNPISITLSGSSLGELSSAISLGRMVWQGRTIASNVTFKPYILASILFVEKHNPLQDSCHETKQIREFTLQLLRRLLIGSMAADGVSQSQ